MYETASNVFSASPSSTTRMRHLRSSDGAAAGNSSIIRVLVLDGSFRCRYLRTILFSRHSRLLSTVGAGSWPRAVKSGGPDRGQDETFSLENCLDLMATTSQNCQPKFEEFCRQRACVPVNLKGTRRGRKKEKKRRKTSQVHRVIPEKQPRAKWLPLAQPQQPGEIS